MYEVYVSAVILSALVILRRNGPEEERRGKDPRLVTSARVADPSLRSE
jgi:hypothetical protein